MYCSGRSIARIWGWSREKRSDPLDSAFFGVLCVVLNFHRHHHHVIVVTLPLPLPPVPQLFPPPFLSRFNFPLPNPQTKELPSINIIKITLTPNPQPHKPQTTSKHQPFCPPLHYNHHDPCICPIPCLDQCRGCDFTSRDFQIWSPLLALRLNNA